MRLRRIVLAATTLVFVAGCRVSPKEADAFVSPDKGFSSAPIGTQILLYIPNRVIDALDMVHVGYGLGPGFGPEFHFTRNGRLGAVAGADAGIGWFGKWTSPYQYGTYARAVAGSSETKNARGQQWRPPKWDIGALWHALLDFAYVAVAPDEIVDFLAGWATYDTKKDDWPIGPPPKKERPATRPRAR